MLAAERKPAFSLWGASRVGTALAYHLTRAGWRPHFLWNRSPEHLSRTLQYVQFAKASCRMADFDGGGEWLVIAVRDDALAEVAQRLAVLPLEWRGKKALHVSGFFSSAILQPLAEQGVLTGSLHPVLSIPTIEYGIETLGEGIFTCEGQIQTDLEEIVRQLGGRAFCLTPAQKKLIHVAAVFLNNYQVALTQALQQCGQEVGLKPEDFVTLLLPTMQQVLTTWARPDAVQRITGPAARGDLTTIRAHQQLLERHPALRRLYDDYLALVRQLLHEKGLHPELPKDEGE